MRFTLPILFFLLITTVVQGQTFYMEAGGLGTTRFMPVDMDQPAFNINSAGFYLELGSERWIYDKGLILWAIGYSFESGNGEYNMDFTQDSTVAFDENWRHSSVDLSYMYRTDFESKWNLLFSGGLGVGLARRQFTDESTQSEAYLMFPTVNIEAGLLYSLTEELEINLMLRGGGNYNVRLRGNIFQTALGFGLGLRYVIVE